MNDVERSVTTFERILNEFERVLNEFERDLNENERSSVQVREGYSGAAGVVFILSCTLSANELTGR